MPKRKQYEIKENPFEKDLYDAKQMAEFFEENAIGKDTYCIKEGWDLYDIIHSLIVLNRALKRIYTINEIEGELKKDKIENKIEQNKSNQNKTEEDENLNILLEILWGDSSNE